jgi:hypothetical protein
MKSQMIRVISSPSSSTTGLATLIFDMLASWAGVILYANVYCVVEQK